MGGGNGCLGGGGRVNEEEGVGKERGDGGWKGGEGKREEMKDR